MRIAFYAPLKGPDHPVPSGDRQMARLLIAALRAGGHTVDLVSTLRSFAKMPDAGRLAAIEGAAAAEVQVIERAWREGEAAHPDLWFTYHPFYKAPDFLGPSLAAAWGIPYVTAEASNAPKRAEGPWASWHAASEAALKAAALHFCFTDQDAAGLAQLLGGRQTIVALPPFIDAATFRSRPPRRASRTVRLIAVAMMRQGDKMRSYAFLAEALRRVPNALDWHLSIVGDGPARAEVEAAFSALAARVSLCGLLDSPAVNKALRNADLYVWPGFNEAYGISYLEAGAAGLPALAMRCGGIANVIDHDETGVLVPEGDIDAYAAALARLIGDPALRARLGAAAKTLVTTERTVLRAAEILGAGLGRSLR